MQDLIIQNTPSTGGGGATSLKVDKNGTLIGTRPEINLIEGSNVTMTVADNAGSNRVDITINSSGSGGGGVPSTISDLVAWYQGDKQPSVTNGKTVSVIADTTPNQPVRHGISVNSTGASALAPALNGLNGWTLPGTVNGRYQMPTGSGIILATATIFVVYKITAYGAANGGDFVCGNASSLEFRIDPTGHLQLVQAFTANIALGTGISALGTWYQANATYDSASGAFAFRRASAADGSGVNAKAITIQTNALFYNPPASTGDYNGAIAEMIVYNRVLSGAEINTVEAYLLAKWGV